MSRITRPFLRRTLAAMFLAAAVLAVPDKPVSAQACTAEQLADAVDQAGGQLRAITAANQPKLEARIATLKAKRGWTDADAEDKAYAELSDARTVDLDRTANELLARIDTLGNVPARSVPECGRLQELEAASLELQAAVKAKAAYMLARLDALIAGGGKAAEPAAPVASAPAVAATPKVAPPPVASAPAAAPKPPAAAPAPWSTTTTVEAQPLPPPVVAQPAPQAPAQASTPDDDGYTIDEIIRTSSGFFGKVSSGLGGVVEHAFSKAGRPAGYILGTEGGGAFLAGLRYGKGTLYLRSGGSMPIFWHGPSVGLDVGGQGAQVMFLVYRLRDPEQLMSTFTGIEGSAFVAGGIGFTVMTNGDVQLAPIRSGVGLRIGANIGYTRFTRRQTWNPF